MKHWIFICLSILALHTVAGENSQRAKELAQKTIIVDGHIDLPIRLLEKMEDVSKRSPSGQMDYVRAIEGGLNAPFMSIFTPARLQKEPGASFAHANKLIDLVENLERNYPFHFAIPTSVAEIRAQAKSALVSLPMGMENGSPLEGKLENIEYFHKRGIRYITLTHGKDNDICDSSYDDTRTWKGLSAFGRDVVKAMNDTGIMIDISHISDDTFYQVMDLTNTPVIASHSSCRHFTPNFERNMGDEMIKKLAENQGVIMINFGSYFISERYRIRSKEASVHLDKYAEENNLDKSSKAFRAYRDKYRNEHIEMAHLDDVFDHIDHVVKLVGIDYVGLGSDYDGVGDTLPTNLKDVASYPNLIEKMLDEGYSESDIEKICSGNVLRVWSAVEAYARKGKK